MCFLDQGCFCCLFKASFPDFARLGPGPEGPRPIPHLGLYLFSLWSQAAARVYHVTGVLNECVLLAKMSLSSLAFS